MHKLAPLIPNNIRIDIATQQNVHCRTYLAALIAGDTGTNIVRVSCLRKSRKIGIRNQWPDHFDPISLLFCKNTFSLIGVHNASCREDGNSNYRFDGGR
jgi:hypothetical protein